MRRPNRRRALAIPLALLFLAVLASLTTMATRVRRGLDDTLMRTLAGSNMERLLLACLEETHYQLAMAHPPAGSASAAEDRILAATRLGPGGRGWEGFPVPAADAGLLPEVLDHDLAAFLLDSSATLHFAPVSMASTLSRETRIELAPVEVRVLRREAGEEAVNPFAGELVPSSAARAALGLPPEVDALRATWGVLELRAHAERGSFLRGVRRTVVQHRLFAVVEYTPSGDEPRVYCHVFPAPLAQEVTRG